jgi:hypothetical protein
MTTRAKALVSPMADFWLLGGLSIVLLIPAGLWVGWHDSASIDRVYSWSYYAALVVNFPHFAYSYQVFYEGLLGRLRHPETSLASRARIVLAGFVVPAALLSGLAVILATRNADAMGWAINIMLLLGGWHYARQGYGTLIASSVYRGIFYGPRQKFMLNLNSYVIPLYAWIKVNTGKIENPAYFDIPNKIFGFSRGFADAMGYVCIIAGVLALGVLLRVWLVDRRGLALNGITGYFSSTYLWVLLVYLNPALYYFGPFFHSLQYLPFIYKYEKGKTAAAADETRKRESLRSLILFAVTGLFLGLVFLDFLPKEIDGLLERYGGEPFISRNFFVIAAFLFVSVHHYFIDYAFWRRDNQDVQKFVFRA